jgi:hypothetical protein
LLALDGLLAPDGLPALDDLLAPERLLAPGGLLAPDDVPGPDDLLVPADLVAPEDRLEPEDPFEPDARLERVGLLGVEPTLRLGPPAPVVVAAARVCPLLAREGPEVVPEALLALLRALVVGLREPPPALALLLLLDVLRLDCFGELLVVATTSPFPRNNHLLPRDFGPVTGARSRSARSVVDRTELSARSAT